MPKINFLVSKRQTEIRDDLLEFTGGARYMTLQGVMDYIGFRDRKTAMEWVSGMPHLLRGNRKTYCVTDVAKRLCEQEVRS